MDCEIEVGVTSAGNVVICVLVIAVLVARLISLIPDGTDTSTSLRTEVGAPINGYSHFTSIVIVELFGRVESVVEIVLFHVMVNVGHAAPPVVFVQVALTLVAPSKSVLANCDPLAGSGQLFVTMIVYVKGYPLYEVVGQFMITERSAVPESA